LRQKYVVILRPSFLFKKLCAFNTITARSAQLQASDGADKKGRCRSTAQVGQAANL
jgi:hypothetical protein